MTKMMGITKTEAKEYITSLPVRNQLNKDDYWLRGFAFIMAAIACCTLGTVSVAFAFMCAAVFGVALITSCKPIMNKWAIAHHIVLSDSFVFLSCSVDFAVITTYIIYKMNGSLAMGLVIPVSINVVDIFLVAIYARAMIKRGLYKKGKGSGTKAALLGVGCAGSGWIMAKYLFAGTTGNQQLGILAVITLLLGLMCNFGLVGFVKYYCCTLVSK